MVGSPAGRDRAKQVSAEAPRSEIESDGNSQHRNELGSRGNASERLLIPVVGPCNTRDLGETRRELGVVVREPSLRRGEGKGAAAGWGRARAELLESSLCGRELVLGRSKLGLRGFDLLDERRSPFPAPRRASQLRRSVLPARHYSLEDLGLASILLSALQRPLELSSDLLLRSDELLNRNTSIDDGLALRDVLIRETRLGSASSLDETASARGCVRRSRGGDDGEEDGQHREKGERGAHVGGVEGT